MFSLDLFRCFSIFRFSLLRALMPWAAVTLLVACGGGGSSSTNPNACGAGDCSPQAAIVIPAVTTLYAGQPVVLDGSTSRFSDSFRWLQTAGEPVTLTGSNSAVAQFVAPTFSSEQTLRFKLVVSDQYKDSSADISFVVKPLTVTVATSSDTVIPGEPFELRASGGDDSGELRYQWQQIDGDVDVQLDDANNAVASITSRIVRAATTATFRVTVTNKYNATAFANVTLNLAEGVIPSITSITPAYAAPGEQVKISGSGFTMAYAVRLAVDSLEVDSAYEIRSDHEIQVTLPAVSAGSYVLSVRNSGGEAQEMVAVGEPLRGATQIAAGSHGSCALMLDRTVSCWGEGVFGQLGNGWSSNSAKPVNVLTSANEPLRDVMAISSGALNFCALVESGAIYCWGLNNFGQLGDGTKTNRNFAVEVNLPIKAASIAIGSNHGCALTYDGVAYCWGIFFAGWPEFDLGGINLGGSPVKIENAGAFSAIASGGAHSCGIQSNGSVRCWGINNFGQLGNGTKVSSIQPTTVLSGTAAGNLQDVTGIALGSNHTCATFGDHRVRCWGNNDFGQLGTGENEIHLYPEPVILNKTGTQLAGVVEVYAARGYHLAGSKGDHTCALLTNSTVICWGKNDAGQLGNRENAASNVPLSVGGITQVAAMALGSAHSCVLKVSGEVLCWGANSADQLGWPGHDLGQKPVVISELSSVIAISMGGLGSLVNTFGCALTDVGIVSCWGQNDMGQLGNTSSAHSALPIPVGGLRNVSAISSGTQHSCALSNGAIFCWGADDFGQLGGSSTVKSVELPEQVAAIGVGSAHSCGVLVSGQVFCWGSNGAGQLGSASFADSEVPVEVMNLPSAAQRVVAGAAHTCALLEGGNIYCWGRNTSGQLGNGSLENSNVPVPVALSLPAVTIAAGVGHTCATVMGGNVYCWGDTQDDGGDENTKIAPRPILMSSVADSIAVSTGGAWFYVPSQSFSCALRSGGMVFCWGDNSVGQLGMGADINIHAGNIPDLFNIQSISSGGTHSCGLYNDGYVSCWGGVYPMQLGQSPEGPRAVLR